MGNSPAVIFQHYRALVTPEAAEKYWKLLPTTSDVDAGELEKEVERSEALALGEGAVRVERFAEVARAGYRDAAVGFVAENGEQAAPQPRGADAEVAAAAGI
ncbi:MAG TPA: hypothetical protein VIT91_05515 [Chthoniobacterales bacterium]